MKFQLGESFFVDFSLCLILPKWLTSFCLGLRSSDVLLRVGILRRGEGQLHYVRNLRLSYIDL
jgi:hypothetical protein